MSTRSHGQAKPVSASSAVPAAVLQRKCACGGTPGPTGECADCRRKRQLGGTVQTKLRVNQPGDKYEQEADRVADMVMRMPEPRLQLQVEPEEEEEEETLQTKPIVSQITPLIQRQVAPEEEEDEEGIQMKPLPSAGSIQRQTIEEEEEDEEVQAKELPGRTPVVTPQIQARINALRGGGQPLPKSVRAFFEPRFGVDFSRTRIHTGPVATEITRSLNARAFTLGRGIFFNEREFQPGTGSGNRLLAHELAHIVQQTCHDSTELAQRATQAETGSSPLGSAPLDIENVPDNYLVCAIVCYFGIPPGVFKDIVALVSEAIAASASKALSQEDVRRLRELKGSGISKLISKLKLVLDFLVKGKIYNVPIPRAARTLRIKALRLALQYTTGASLRMGLKWASRVNLATTVLFAAECAVACSKALKQVITDALSLPFQFLNFLEEAETIGIGLIRGGEQEAIYRDIYEFEATMDPLNWDSTTVLPEAEEAVDLLEDISIELLETFDKALVEEGALEFRRLSLRPIRELGVDPGKVERIVTLVNEFLADEPDRILFFETEEELESNPRRFFTLMLDALLVDFEEFPEDVADRLIQESLETATD